MNTIPLSLFPSNSGTLPLEAQIPIQNKTSIKKIADPIPTLPQLKGGEKVNYILNGYYCCNINPKDVRLALNNKFAHYTCNRCHKRNSIAAKMCRKCHCIRFHTIRDHHFTDRFRKALIKEKRPTYWKSHSRK